MNTVLTVGAVYVNHTMAVRKKIGMMTMGYRHKKVSQPARRRCPRVPGCRNFHPCGEHPQGWAGSTSEPLPTNWSALVLQTRRDYQDRCAKCGKLCPPPYGNCDHIVGRARGGGHERSNRQWLCLSCHQSKTKRESKDGRRKRRF